MSEAKHTPGPWKVLSQGSEDDCIIRTVINNAPEGLNEICIVTTGSFEDFTEKSNARLIAAAPELLEILKEWSGLADHLQLSTFRHRERTKAAIAKAEGK